MTVAVNSKTKINSMDFKELIVYQKAFKLAMDIFEISKSFPKEEQYSLTDQIRRSSRSTCTINLLPEAIIFVLTQKRYKKVKAPFDLHPTFL